MPLAHPLSVQLTAEQLQNRLDQLVQEEQTVRFLLRAARGRERLRRRRGIDRHPHERI